MKSKIQYIAYVLTLTCLASTSSAKQARLEADLDRKQIYVGESAQIIVTVHNIQNSAAPDVSKIKDCNTSLINQHEQISVFNGRSTTKHIFFYKITPNKKGSFFIGPINLKTSKNILTTDAGTLSVFGIEKQDHLIVKLDSSKRTVVVDETFAITLSVLTKRLSGTYADIDPIASEYPPAINAAFLEQNEIENLEGTDIHRFLSSRVVQNKNEPRFSINDYTASSSSFHDPFSIFDDRPARRAGFHLDRTDVIIDGIPYYKYFLTLKYTPTDTGTHRFGPVSFKGKVITSVTPDGTASLTPIYAMAPAITITVQSPPQENRPLSYIGAIGTNIIVNATLDAQTCNTGDPLSLTLSISGDIRLDAISPPKLELQPDLTKDFRLYENTVKSKTKENSRLYTYTIRPTTVGTLEFPSVKISYYNTNSKRYETVSTKPIPVRANETVRVHDSTVISTHTRDIQLGDYEIDQSIFVPAPLMVTDEKLQSVAVFSPALHIPLICLGPLLYALLLLTHRIKRYSIDSSAYRKQKTAGAHAVSALIKARATARTSPAQAASTLKYVILHYISDRFTVTARSITPYDVRRILSDATPRDSASMRLCDIFESYSNMDFAENANELSNIKMDISETAGIIDHIENILKQDDLAHKKSGAMSSAIQIAVFFLFFSLISSESFAETTETLKSRFIWNAAQTHAFSARSENDFTLAAKSYQTLIDSGIHNGVLFYNYGVTLLLSNHPEQAFNAFCRSERYLGINWNIRRNMRIAIAGDRRDISPSLPWYRIPLFWHYGLSLRIRITIASTAFLGIWIALLFRYAGFIHTYRRIMVFSVFIFILFASSVGTTILQESKADSVMQQPLILSPSSAILSPSPSSKEAVK